jgi:hypothetical protein
MAIRARYQGDGNEYIPSVPRRDLDADEYDALDMDARKAVRDTKRGDGEKLYDVATEKAARPAAEGKSG